MRSSIQVNCLKCSRNSRRGSRTKLSSQQRIQRKHRERARERNRERERERDDSRSEGHKPEMPTTIWEEPSATCFKHFAGNFHLVSADAVTLKPSCLVVALSLISPKAPQQSGALEARGRGVTLVRSPGERKTTGGQFARGR